MAEKGKIKCTDCEWTGKWSDVQISANPFNIDEEIYGCPNCKRIDKFLECCDEPECWAEATCGAPTPDGGYRQTCWEHVPKAKTGKVRPGSRWKPIGGCYGKIHLVVDGKSLCGLEGEWFQEWNNNPPITTCRKCQNPK